MTSSRSRLRPLIIPPRKHVEFECSPTGTGTGKLGFGGTLSPDLQPSSPPTFPHQHDPLHAQRVYTIGKYLLLKEIDSNGHIHIHKAIHVNTQEEYTCKVIPINKYRDTLAAYWRANSHEHVSEIEEILLGETQAYVFFAQNYGDLHSYVRAKRKLRESEASNLFRQIVSAVAHCHENGIVLRDLKLRKFVFKDPEKTILMLEGLEDACLLDDTEDDALNDKHGCPAYVSPEILQTSATYSGRAADAWSLGVMLYTLLVGRYPFHDTEPAALFKKIRRGQYKIPESVSSRARCLLRSLLRMEASERLTAEEALEHPWFRAGPAVAPRSGKGAEKDSDQMVPDIVLDNDNDSIFSH